MRIVIDGKTYEPVKNIDINVEQSSSRGTQFVIYARGMKIDSHFTEGESPEEWLLGKGYVRLVSTRHEERFNGWWMSSQSVRRLIEQKIVFNVTVEYATEVSEDARDEFILTWDEMA